jgi:hypothetical protein
MCYNTDFETPCDVAAGAGHRNCVKLLKTLAHQRPSSPLKQQRNNITRATSTQYITITQTLDDSDDPPRRTLQDMESNDDEKNSRDVVVDHDKNESVPLDATYDDARVAVLDDSQVSTWEQGGLLPEDIDHETFHVAASDIADDDKSTCYRDEEYRVVNDAVEPRTDDASVAEPSFLLDPRYIRDNDRSSDSID